MPPPTPKKPICKTSTSGSSPNGAKNGRLIAVARSILVGIYHMLSRGRTWQDLGADYFERRNPVQIIARLTHRLQNLGYQVALTPIPMTS